MADLATTRPRNTTTGADPIAGGSLGPGATLGRYLLVRQLGRGGCGEVFVAFDPVLDRKVALKVLPTHASGAAWVREARMLARVPHPGIVTVHDAGMHEGRGYLAMELVDGPDLQHWLQTQAERPRWSAVLALLRGAGAALAAAHREGVVHGDIKPANILVSDAGARVTDFGVARFVRRSSLEEREHGDDDAPRFVGTPAYMAPEQLEGRPADEHSDQYSFCLTLWEALFGVPAFEADSIGVGATVAGSGADASVGTPQSGSAPGTPMHLAMIAHARAKGPPPAPTSTDVPARIVEALRRGLEPDPARRWPTFEALLEALAFEPSRRRQQLALVGTGVVAIAAGGVAAASWMQTDDRCTGATAEIEEVWNDAQRDAVAGALRSIDAEFAGDVAPRVVAAIDEYAAEWVQRHTASCEATTIRGERSPVMMDLQMACLSGRKSALRETVSVLASADAGTVRNAHAVVDRLPDLQRCDDFDALSDDAPAPPDPAIAERVAELQAKISRATALEAAGRFAEAVEVMETVAPQARELGYAPLHAEATVRLGLALSWGSDTERATEVVREGLATALEHGPKAVAVEAASRLTEMSAADDQDPAVASAFAIFAEGLARRWVPGTRTEAAVLGNVGILYAEQGHFDRSIEYFTRAKAMYADTLGPDHTQVIEMMENLAIVELQRRHPKQAEATFREALALKRAELGERHPSVGMTLDTLGTTLREQGEFAQAEAAYREALAIFTDAVGEEHRMVADTMTSLAAAVRQAGRNDEAEALMLEALRIREKTLGPDHPAVADSLLGLAHFHMDRGDYVAAEEADRRALDLTLRSLGDAHPQAAVARLNLSLALLGQERFAEAEPFARQAVEQWERVSGPESPHLALPLYTLGLVLNALSRWEDAEATLTRSMEIVEIEPSQDVAKEDLEAALARVRQRLPPDLD